jgi:hypothetical protein
MHAPPRSAPNSLGPAALSAGALIRARGTQLTRVNLVLVIVADLQATNRCLEKNIRRPDSDEPVERDARHGPAPTTRSAWPQYVSDRKVDRYASARLLPTLSEARELDEWLRAIVADARDWRILELRALGMKQAGVAKQLGLTSEESIRLATVRACARIANAAPVINQVAAV